MNITQLSNLTIKTFKANNNEVVRVSSRANKMFKNLSKFQKSKNEKFRTLIHTKNIRAIRESIFLTFDTKKVFNRLK